MRQPKTSGPGFTSSQPAPWMKVAFFIEVAVFVLGALFLWDQWESAQADLANRRRQQKAKQEAVDNLRRENANSYDFLNKYNNDEDFRRRVARQRLGYVEPGETVFRLDPPPKSATTPAENDKPAK